MMSPYAQLIIGVALIAFALYFVIIIHKGAAIHTSQISSEMGFVGAILYKASARSSASVNILCRCSLAIVGLRFCAPKLAINNRIIVTSVVIVVCLLAFRHLSFEPSLAIEKAWRHWRRRHRCSSRDAPGERALKGWRSDRASAIIIVALISAPAAHSDAGS